MVEHKKNRKGSRKGKGRKGKGRKTNVRKSRKSSARRCGMWGGDYSASKLSLSQGQDFLSQHTRQHGGAYAPLGGAPVGDQGLLPQELRDMARVTPVDMKNSEIIGMHDPDQMGGVGTMTGGRRRKLYMRKSRKSNMRKARKSRKSNMRKSRKTNMRKTRKSRKTNMRKSRRSNMRRGQRGGARTEMGGAPYDSPNMLLSPSEAAKAGTGDFSNPLLKQ